MTTPNSTNQANQGNLNARDDGDEIVLDIPSNAVHPHIASGPHPDQQEMFPAKVNGQDVMLTREQVTAHLQKDMAGDEKLRQAAEMQKEASTAIALQDDMKAVLKDGDVDALRRLGAGMGISGVEVEQIAQNFLIDDGIDEDDEDVVAAFQDQTPNPTRKVGYDGLTSDLQRVMRLAETQRIKEFVDKALDNDELVSYNMSRLSDKGQAEIRKLVDEKVRGRLDGVGGDFGDGSQILPEIVQEIKGLFTEALGSPERSHGSMSLGASPGGGDSEIYPQKLPDHVPSTEGDKYTQNIMETMQFYHNEAERGKR